MRGAREAETRARAPLSEAERKAQRLETEVGTLTKLLGSTSGGLWPTASRTDQRRQGL